MNKSEKILIDMITCPYEIRMFLNKANPMCLTGGTTCINHCVYYKEHQNDYVLCNYKYYSKHKKFSLRR